MVQIKKSGIEKSKLNAGNLGRSLEFCGLGDKRKAVSVNVKRKLPAPVGNRSICGIMGLMDRYDLCELQRTWSGFLNGETLYIPDNVLMVRSRVGVIPDREAGKCFAREITTNGNPYFGFTGKMDQYLDVETEFVEDSVRVTYFRSDKHVQPKQNRKVTMKIAFGLRVRLKKPLDELPPKFLDNPYFIETDRFFYPMLKSLLAHPEEFHLDVKNGYVCRKPTVAEDGNRLFALDFGLYLNDSYPYRDFKPVMGPLEYLHAQRKLENPMQKDWLFFNRFRHVLISKDETTPYTLTESDLDQALQFVKTAFDETLAKKNFSGPHRQFFGCLTVGLNLPLAKSRFFKHEDYVKSMQSDLEKIASYFDELKKCLRVETVEENAPEWVALMGSEGFYGRPYERQFYKSSYARALVMEWISKVQADPIMYADSETPVIANLARSCVNGVLYGT